MRSPQIVWLELTSKCPFDCTFCSRRNRRGAGMHMPIQMVAEICSSLPGAGIIRLNYSGESVNHPQFDRALLLAHQTGAQTELVTALASTPATHLRAFVDAGLDRLSVSLHTLDAEQFSGIYRFSSVAQFRSKIADLESYKIARSSPTPELDFSFVAMRSNLGQLEPIASYARSLGVRSITVHPVIQRDPADADVTWELSGPQQLRPQFARELEEAVGTARTSVPEVSISVSRPLEVRPPIPDGAPFTCDQNPFETTHILASGSVVPCEVLDKRVLGDLNNAGFTQIWNGDGYQQFRSDYREGKVEACQRCEFRKVTPSVGLLTPSYGWHERDTSGTLWSRAAAEANFNGKGEGFLRIDGILPCAPSGLNRLEISSDTRMLARVHNKTGASLAFSVEVPLRAAAGGTVIRFAASEPVRAVEDIRELGFALTESCWTPIANAPVAVPVSVRRTGCVRMLLEVLDRADRRPLPPFSVPPLSNKPGVSVLIPARGPADILISCLKSLRGALDSIQESVEVIVLVNGSDPKMYREAMRIVPKARFRFHAGALGFSRAISKGLEFVRHPWVYLLNSDMTVHPDAIHALLARRAPNVFGLASRIALSDGRRVETGYTRLRLAFGRADLVDAEPEEGSALCPNLYCGGGSSLFQTAMLRQLARESHCYDPFYWEDAEWGVTARTVGLESIFVGESRVNHSHRSTVNRFYQPSDVRRILERNRILFQLRCLPSLIEPDALRHALEQVCPETAREILTPRNLWPAIRKRRRMLSAGPSAVPAFLRDSE